MKQTFILIFLALFIFSNHVLSKEDPKKVKPALPKKTAPKKNTTSKTKSASKKPPKASPKVKEITPKKKKAPHPNLFSVTLLEDFPDSHNSLDKAREIILNHYYTPDITENALNFAAVQGMLRFISPPHKKEHSVILKPKDFKKLERKMRGKTLSIGIKYDFNSRDGSLTITEVIPGSPADGVLMADDRILRVDDLSLKEKSKKEIDALIDGEENTKVSLKVIRDIQVFDISLIRKEFKTPNLKVFKLADNIAVIEIRSMTKGISIELKENLLKLKKENYKKIILDLRSNPGGLFQEGLKIADLFLPPKSITLRIVNHKPQIQKVVASEPNPIEVDMAILVNKNTASSCEILSAALQDHKKAVLVGTNTYGKSLIDKLFPLPNKFRIKFISGSMYGPLGKTWYRKGLTPNIPVDQDIAEFNKLKKIPPLERLKTDKPLLTAYNHLKKEK